MSIHGEKQSQRERGWLYIVTVIVLVLLGVTALLTFKTARDTAQAVDKAEELIQELTDAGANVTLDAQQIARVLGEDGGAVCANPNSALSRAVLHDRIANGASSPGIRPIITDTRYLQGQIAILTVYCPEEVEEFQEFVDSLATTDVQS
jgi:hypothetical protein